MNDRVAYKRVTATISNEHSYCLYCYEAIDMLLINLCEGVCVLCLHLRMFLSVSLL